MSRTLLYLDSSAIIKLIVKEPETDALFAFLREWSELISSAIVRVEVLRALRRARGGGGAYHRGQDVLARLALVRLNEEIADTAAGLDPLELRALDAIHLASALSVRENLAGIVTYDIRLARAARSIPIRVWAPR